MSRWPACGSEIALPHPLVGQVVDDAQAREGMIRIDTSSVTLGFWGLNRLERRRSVLLGDDFDSHDLLTPVFKAQREINVRACA